MSASSFRSESLAVILGCLLWAGSAPALDPALEMSQYGHGAWRIRDGFAKGASAAFAQTPDGYLWIGTEFGLLRFDGVRATPWVAPGGAALPSDRVRALATARDGTLWIATLLGLAAWDGRNFLTVPQLDGMMIHALHQDREGTVWIGTSVGMSEGRLCAIRAGAAQCSGEDGSFGIGVAGIYEQRNGALWSPTGQNEVSRWKPAPVKKYSVPGTIGNLQVLSEDESGALLVGTLNGIWKIDERGVHPYPLPGTRSNVRVSALLRDKDGALWIGTREAGLLHVHGGRIDAFGRADGLSGDHVNALFEDREGNIWVATADGIDRFRALAVTTHMKARAFSVLAARDGSLWFSTDTEVKRWRGDGPLDAGVRGLPREGLASLFEDHRGRVWVGFPSTLGYIEHGSFTPIDGAPRGYIDSFAEDKDGNIWLARREGLLRISPDLRIRDITAEDKAPIRRRLAADPLRGGIWIGAYSGGLTHFVAGRVAASYSARDGLGRGAVSQVLVAAEGTVWAATEGGLSRLKNGRVATLDARGGLPCDQVHWMIEDTDRAWWLYTACGLVRLARSELEAWTSAVDAGKAPRRIVTALLDISDGVRGMASAGSSAPQAARSADGKLWFVTRDGLTVIDPHDIRSNPRPPPVHVEGIVADRKAYEPSSGVRLPALVRDVHIEYTATSLVAPEKAQFKYKLEGRDKIWNDAGGRRQAFYTDLDPGNYRFRVIASNNSGVWNEEGASLEFSVAPAYWQTWWFRASCLAALAILLWALYRWRVRQIARQYSMTLDARVAERTRIARELHDTLLQGFHGVLLRFQTVLELLPHRASDAKQMLASTIDQAAAAITEGRDAVQGLRASATQTNDLAESIQSLGDELADEAGGKVAVRIEVLGVPRPLHPIVRDEIFRIASEALRNAFRHAGAQRIEVELRYDPRQLRLGVRDDGRGIAPEVLSAGGREGHFGLHGMRERAKLIGGNLTVWSAAQAGTEVELAVPAASAYAPPAGLESAA